VLIEGRIPAGRIDLLEAVELQHQRAVHADAVLQRQMALQQTAVGVRDEGLHASVVPDEVIVHAVGVVERVAAGVARIVAVVEDHCVAVGVERARQRRSRGSGAGEGAERQSDNGEQRDELLAHCVSPFRRTIATTGASQGPLDLLCSASWLPTSILMYILA